MLKYLFGKKESDESENHEFLEAMEALRYQTEQLLTLLEIRTEPLVQAPQQTTAMQIQVLESYLSLVKNTIQSQRDQANEQIDRLKDEMQKNQKALGQLEEMRRRLEGTNKQLEQELLSLREEIDQKNRILENTERQRLSLEDMWETEKAQRLQAESDVQAQKTAFMELCSSLIRFRDQLWVQWDYARKSQSDEAVHAVSGALALSRSVMEEARVEVLDGGGMFDRERHRAVETAVTDNPAQDWQIQRTVKEGYAFQGKLIRQQEVTIFRYTQQEANENTMNQNKEV